MSVTQFVEIRERARTTEHEGSVERVGFHVGPPFEVETSTACTGTHCRSGERTDDETYARKLKIPSRALSRRRASFWPPPVAPSGRT